MWSRGRIILFLVLGFVAEVLCFLAIAPWLVQMSWFTWLNEHHALVDPSLALVIYVALRLSDGLVFYFCRRLLDVFDKHDPEQAEEIQKSSPPGSTSLF